MSQTISPIITRLVAAIDDLFKYSDYFLQTSKLKQSHSHKIAGIMIYLQCRLMILITAYMVMITCIQMLKRRFSFLLVLSVALFGFSAYKSNNERKLKVAGFDYSVCKNYPMSQSVVTSITFYAGCIVLIAYWASHSEFDFTIPLQICFLYGLLSNHMVLIKQSALIVLAISKCFFLKNPLNFICTQLIMGCVEYLLVMCLLRKHSKFIYQNYKLEKATQLYTSLLNATNDAIIIVSNKKKQHFANKKATNEIEINQQNIEAKLKLFINKETHGTLYDDIFRTKAFTSHKCVMYSYNKLRDFGKSVDYEIKCMQLFYKHRIAIFFKDVTISVELGTAKMEEKFHRKVICTISHELLNPVNIILGSLDLLMKEYTGDTELIDTVYNFTLVLLYKIKDFIDYSTLIKGTFKPSSKPFLFHSLLKQLFKICSNMITEDKVDLKFNIQKSIPEELDMDGDRLMQILLKLISNSIKHTESGKIELNISQLASSKLHVEVSDSGKGIPSHILNYILNDRRCSTLVDESINFIAPQTANIGLLTIKKMLDSMDSKLNIKSIEGKGSKIFFDLSMYRGVLRKQSNKNLSFEAKKIIITSNECPTTLLSVTSISSNSTLCQKSMRTLKVIKDSIMTSLIPRAPSPKDDSIQLQHLDTLVTKFSSKTGTNPKKILVKSSIMEVVPEDGKSLMNSNEVSPKSLQRVIFGLIVDDNKQNRTILKSYLKGIDISIVEFTNGKEVLDYFTESYTNPSTYFLIFMDIDMPIMNGIESATTIMMLDNAKSKATIIAISAFQGDKDIAACLDAGMSFHMAKPVAKSTFVEKVNELISKYK